MEIEANEVSMAFLNSKAGIFWQLFAIEAYETSICLTITIASDPVLLKYLQVGKLTPRFLT